MRPRVEARLSVRVVDLDGHSVVGSEVECRSMADSVSDRTDERGRVVFESVPVREWRVTADVPGGVPVGLVHGRARTSLQQGEVEVALRRGVPMRVHADGIEERRFALGIGAGSVGPFLFREWLPDSSGAATIHVDPDWASVHVVAIRVEPRDEWSASGMTLGLGSAPVAAGATVTIRRTR
jgi:hypothetical protein